MAYLGLAIANALNTYIWSNEAWFASPGYTLAHHGFLGTTILESKGTWMEGIDRHTYWMPPVFLLLEGLFFKLFGFGLLAMRSISILAGIAALLAWYSVIATLSANRTIALLAAAIIAIDFHFAMYGALGRPDMVCAALGTIGFALFLHYRARSIRKALLLGHGFAAAACLTHPCGVLYATGLVLFMLLFDWQRIGWRSAGLIAVPYVAALAAWGIYIAQAPTEFVHQFTGNISGIASEFSGASRGAFMSNPLRAIRAEYGLRYAANFGRYSTTWAERIPLVALAIYTLAVGCCLFVRKLREHSGIRALLLIGAFDYLFMAFFDGLKGSAYLVHTLPLCAVFLAWSIWYFTAGQLASRLAIWAAAAALTLFAGAQLEATLRNVIHNPQSWDYDNAVDFLRREHAPAAIIAGGEFAFALGFESGAIDDPRLGYYSGMRPEYLVLNPIIRGWIEHSAKLYPEIHAYQVKLLAEEYRMVFHNSHYTIYRHI